MKIYIVSKLYQDGYGICYNSEPTVFKTNDEAINFLKKVYKQEKEQDTLSNYSESGFYNEKELRLYNNDDTYECYEIFEMEVE